ncbi:MAG: DUF4126 domain-containing protein [Gammaproteobacteria bacterium]
MTAIDTIALTMGAAWASGINLYAAVFVLGYLGSTGQITLPPDLMVLTDPLVLAAAGFMYCVEFFADKTPGVDTGWDAIHSFIRIPAGAILAAGAVAEVGPAAQLAAALLGGGIAATTHLTKAGTRVLVNTSPEPFSNWALSIGEDIAVIGGLWAALHYPWAFTVAAVAMVLLMIWLLPRLWRGVQTVFRKLRSLFGGDKASSSASSADPDRQRREALLKNLAPPGKQ